MTTHGNDLIHSFVGNEAYEGNYRGLTKRELFAYGAMRAIVSSIDGEMNYQRLKNLAMSEGLKVSEWIARDACKQADALIKALNDTK